MCYPHIIYQMHSPIHFLSSWKYVLDVIYSHVSGMTCSVLSPEKNTENRVKFMTCSGVFLTNFKVFHLVM